MSALGVFAGLALAKEFILPIVLLTYYFNGGKKAKNTAIMRRDMAHAATEAKIIECLKILTRLEHKNTERSVND